MGFADSEQQLHDQAIAEVGSDDFGDPAYLEGFRVLLNAYDSESKLNDYGRHDSLQKLQILLQRRLRAEQFLTANPQVLQQEIRRPIIICGLVRTGSTALHYLMGQDPGMQNLQYWLGNSPQPRPPRDQWAAHPDFQASEAELNAMYEADPSLKAMHFMMADGPEECRHLLAQSFTDDGFEVNASIPSYSQWYEEADLEFAYRQHKHLIQIIGSRDLEKRWLFKYPVHLRHLPSLFKVYPDACVVWTHRDPAQVLPSYCSLMAGFRAIFEDDTNPRDMSDRQLELWARGADRALAFRQQCAPGQFYDLQFEDFMADPMTAIASIYRYFDQPLSDEAQSRMRTWSGKNRQHKHGKHSYSADIGVSVEAIHERFGNYMRALNVRAE
ncbi:MAG: sulfotransferase [Halieaceae bacterium]|jgi:hypothetical protein|nr:sulfotransferase [Halieaceae bacterium]